MIKEEHIYPRMLYRCRCGGSIAPYKQIKGDIYEDTTCFGHEPCQVRMEYVAEHYECRELLNNSARNFRYLHLPSYSDTHCYSKRSQALKAWYKKLINTRKKQKEASIAKFEVAKKEFAQKHKANIRPQSIWRMDFDYEVFYESLNVSGELPITPRVLTIGRKIMSKRGLECLTDITGETRITDEEHHGFLNVQIANYDEDGLYYNSYIGFMSREDYDAYRNNIEYTEMEHTIADWPKLIASYDADIEALHKEMEEKVKLERDE